MLIPEIDRMKASIVPTERLFTQSDGIISLAQEVLEKTNCYAYALGILFCGDKQRHYVPGFTTGDYFTGKGDIVEKFSTDLENFGIQFRIIPIWRQYFKIEENEYLIKLFYSEDNPHFEEGDFHFVRQDPKTKKWFHKIGWDTQPDLIRGDFGNLEEIGYEPDEFAFQDVNTKLIYHYKGICYFAITIS